MSGLHEREIICRYEVRLLKKEHVSTKHDSQTMNQKTTKKTIAQTDTAKIDIFQNFEKMEIVSKKHRFLLYFWLKLFQALKRALTLLNLVCQNLLYVNIWPLSRQFLTDAL